MNFSNSKENPPLIGILADTHAETGEIRLRERWADSVRKYGAHPFLISSHATEKILARLVQKIDGILLPGGDSNIHPAFYGQIPLPNQTFDPDLDWRAMLLVHMAFEKNMPLLGVCRGMQAMNAAFGGTLQQKLSDIHAHGYQFEDMRKRAEPAHSIQIVEGGILCRIFKEHSEFLDVNSIHFQGITREDLAQEFQVEAIAPEDGVVEVISAPDRTFFLGSQSHLEFENHPLHQAVYKTWIDAASQYQNRRLG